MSAPSPPRPRVLVADDQREVREALRLLLKAEGFETLLAASPAEVIQAFATRDLDVALLDLNYSRDTTSGQEGLDLLGRLRDIDATLPVVVMTPWPTIDVPVAPPPPRAPHLAHTPPTNHPL